jgi:hypothetical protein
METDGTTQVVLMGFLGKSLPTQKANERDQFFIAIRKDQFSWALDEDFRQSLVVEDNIEEGAVHVHPVAAVIQEAQLPEPIQEKTDPAACGAHHFGQHFLTDLRNDRFRLPFFPEMGHQEQHPRQPFLAGIEDRVTDLMVLFGSSWLTRQVPQRTSLG